MNLPPVQRTTLPGSSSSSMSEYLLSTARAAVTDGYGILVPYRESLDLLTAQSSVGSFSHEGVLNEVYDVRVDRGQGRADSLLVVAQTDLATGVTSHVKWEPSNQLFSGLAD
jgi:hypothetical protein